MSGYFDLADWIVIVAYLGGIIAFGVWFGKDQHTTRDYFLGSRNIPWWSIGASIVATETSALTIIGVPAIAYGSNILFIQMIVGYVIARVILAVVMVPHYMKGEIYSPYQLLEQHLGHGPRQMAGAFFLLVETMSAGVRVYVACIPVRLMLGETVCSLGGLVDPILGAILLFVALSLVYTYIGGVKAVVWTDAVQMVLFVAGGLYTLFYIPTLIDGGWSGVLTKAAEAGKLTWLNPSFTLSAPFNIWMGIIGGTVMVMASHGAEQLIVQRVLTARNVSEGRKALVFSAVLIFPIFLIFLLVGVMLWVFYQSHPFRIPLPEPKPGIQSNDFVFPIFMITEVPSVFRGFLIVAILSAAMSSISSAISALASVSTMDFLRQVLKNRSEPFFLRFSKYSTVFWAVALIVVAWLTREVEFVLNVAFSLKGLTSGALLGALLIALFWRRIGARPAMTGMIASMVVMNVIYWPPKIAALRPWWMETFGAEMFWPWFTLIGVVVTLVAAGIARALFSGRRWSGPGSKSSVLLLLSSNKVTAEQPERSLATTHSPWRSRSERRLSSRRISFGQPVSGGWKVAPPRKTFRRSHGATTPRARSRFSTRLAGMWAGGSPGIFFGRAEIFISNIRRAGACFRDCDPAPADPSRVAFNLAALLPVHLYPMYTKPRDVRLPLLCTAVFALPLLSQSLVAQSITPPDAATLAKYDTNRNGRLDPAEIAAMEAAPRTPKPAEVPAAAGDEVIVISPFEVTDSNRGYYAASTMSGTRLNSKVEDLASSITVVTKEQMTDFAMLDINDIFMYEAGTEGAATYTDFSVDRNGSPVDNTSLNPNGSNRVRGVGPANISFGNFETSGRVPIDPINIESVEISRGPNSTVFGLGNAGGTVNMQPASANTSRDRSQLSARVDSYDGYRTSLDLNRVLKKGVLAARGSAVYQHDGFVRQPSGTDTTRLNGMIRYQPFRHTSFTASHSYYEFEGTRTNVTMPRDAVTGWRKAGSPTWDPPTITAKIDGVRVPGTFTASSLPAYFSNANFRTLSTLFIDPSGTIGFWSPSRTTNSTNPDTGNQNIVLVNTVPEPIRATQPLFSSDPSVNSKELYDYSSINLAAMNSNRDRTLTTHVQLEQIFLDSPRNLLALQAGYFRENSARVARTLLGTPGSSGATGFLHVDVNERMIDGSPNPYFLHPFIGIYNVKAHRDNPNKRETGRLQLAYRLDLRQEKNWLRWLGMQQVSAYGEYKDTESRATTYRDTIQSAHAWLPRSATTQSGTDFTPPNVARVYYRYYVGDAAGQNVDYAPRDFAPGPYPYRWGNGLTGQFVTEQATLGSGYWFDSTSGWSRSLLKTQGAVLQSHWLKDRVVTTFGLRRDHTFNHGAADPIFLSGPDGVVLDYGSLEMMDDDGWVLNQGPTKTAGVVVKPRPWLHFHYNQSDSFQPASLAMGLFMNRLPNPTGEGTDYGFTVNLMQGKLLMRVNKYETTQFNSRNSSTRTLAQRVRSLDFDAPYSTVGLTVRARDWVTSAAAEQGITLSTDEINRRVADIAKLDVSTFTRSEDRNEQNGLVAETGDVTAKGVEIELNYNPTAHWTLKLNATKNESIDSNLSPNINRWIEERLPVWEKVIDPQINRPWFTERYANTTSASQYLQSNVLSPLRIANATQGKSRPQIRKYRANVSTSYRLAGLSDSVLLKRFTVGGALRWEDKGAIGYYGVQQLPEIIMDLDPSRPIYDKAHAYADLFVTYRMKLFSNKVNASVQLNVRNIQESGRLQPISAFPDGTPNGYRIVDPRQFILTATFDL